MFAHMYKLCLPRGAVCAEKGSEGLPFLWGTRNGTQMEFSCSTDILLLQERDAEEKKHILAKLGHIKC